MADRDNKGDFLIGLLVGGALGAALALLYAPMAGEETRETIKKKTGELKDTAFTTYDRVKGQTTDLASQVKESTTSLASTVKDSASNVAARAGEAASKVKEDVTSGVADVRAVAAKEAATIGDAARTEVANIKATAASSDSNGAAGA